YCQYGWTRSAASRSGPMFDWPTAQRVATSLEDRLLRATADNEIIDRLTVAGHGEPTLHPEFDEVSARVADVRDRLAPPIPLAILSNSTTAGREDVRRGLARFDERYMKLDAGDGMTYARLSGRGTSLASTVANLRMLPSIVVQAMFVTEPSHEVD